MEKIKKQNEESDSGSYISIPELSDVEDSDWYKDSLDENTITLEKDDFVIVEYKESHFPGNIVQIVADDYEIATIVKGDISIYRWPDKEDKLVYIREQIQNKVRHPNFCSRRGS